MASVTRRAFLGHAAATGGIALATPWWVGWVGKYFGPSGHIHDTKVRGYRPVDVAHAHLQYDVEDHDIPGCATTNISSEVYANDDSYRANADGVYVNASRGGQVWDYFVSWEDNFKGKHLDTIETYDTITPYV